MKIAVNWLIEQITSKPISELTDEEWFGIMGEAKEMHKEEIKDAYYNGGSYEDLSKNEILEIAEQYYTETFNSNEA
jgi:hypothetical protein